MTYDAEFYDAVTPDAFQGDVAWYCRKTGECGGPVLELGAGTGRITLAIAREGVAIHALDASRRMLDALRVKLERAPREVRDRVTVLEGDMRVFELPGGGFVVRSEANWYDTIRQQVHSLHRHEECAPDGSRARTWTHRLDLAYLHPADIRRLLAQAGFPTVTIAGGFDGRDFSGDADELVVEASRR